jgi:hypothetical protein
MSLSTNCLYASLLLGREGGRRRRVEQVLVRLRSLVDRTAVYTDAPVHSHPLIKVHKNDRAATFLPTTVTDSQLERLDRVINGFHSVSRLPATSSRCPERASGLADIIGVYLAP